MCMNPNYIKCPETNLTIFPKSQRFLSVPCGKCKECRVSHAKEWAIRCMCEYESLPVYEKDKCWFITFTYDEEHNPGKLNPEDMTLFWKRLRRNFPMTKIKYFYCGEYGSKSYRPHYHAIVYGLPLTMLIKYKENFAGDNLYISHELEQIWGKGYVVVGALTLKSANYTARYSLKKNDTDCFLRVSHGFGKEFFIQNMQDIILNGYLVIATGKGGLMKAKIPKYFLKIYRKVLNDDKKYSKFIRERMKKHDEYLKKLEKVFRSKYAWEASPVFKQYAKEICLNSKCIDLDSTARRIINQSLYDMYDSRNNFI